MTLKTDLVAARDAVRQALKTALDVDLEPQQLSELWRHYQGIRYIESNYKAFDKLNFDLSGLADIDYPSSPIDDTFIANYDGNISINTVDTGQSGTDTITFS